MNEKLKRRIEKLDRQGVGGFETKLRALARRMGGNEEVYLQAVKGHERELRKELGEEGGITWEGFVRLRDLVNLSGHASSGEAGSPRKSSRH